MTETDDQSTSFINLYFLVKKYGFVFVFFCLQKISGVSEPIDYEQYLVRHKASIMNDPHRDLVLFPPDEVKVSLPLLILFDSLFELKNIHLMAK